MVIKCQKFTFTIVYFTRMYAAMSIKCVSETDSIKRLQVQKDQKLLSGLGVVTCPAPSNASAAAGCRNKVDRLLSDTPGSRLLNDAAFLQPGNGKLTFRSHLTDTERAAVKKVATGRECFCMKGFLKKS
jgi:hypothetical protein